MPGRNDIRDLSRGAMVLILVIVSLSFQMVIELGIIVVVRRGTFPPLWIVLLLIVLRLAAYVLGEYAGVLRGYYAAMDYSDRDGAEKAYGKDMRRAQRNWFILQAAHVILFFGLLIHSFVLLVTNAV